MACMLYFSVEKVESSYWEVVMNWSSCRILLAYKTQLKEADVCLYIMMTILFILFVSALIAWFEEFMNIYSEVFLRSLDLVRRKSLSHSSEWICVCVEIFSAKKLKDLYFCYVEAKKL